MSALVDIDEAATRHGMGTVEVNPNTWRVIMQQHRNMQAELRDATNQLDGAKNLLARAEVTMRQLNDTHRATTERCHLLGQQLDAVLTALGDVLAPDPSPDDWAHATHIHRHITTTTRTTQR
jgi:hypothetical protein